MPLPEFTGTLGTKRATHLLRRATMGPTKEQIAHFASLSSINAINELFPASLPNPSPPIDAKTGQTWVISGATTANSKDDILCDFFKGWFIAQMMNPSAAYSAREKIVLFLHTHFTAIQSKIGSSRALYFQNQLYRQFALDRTAGTKVNFKTLTVKVSVDNAMLRLLDGDLNVNGSVNENYARELFELYSIGRGLEANPPVTSGEAGDYGVYREADVQVAARILSGWDFDEDFTNIDPDTNLPRGRVKGSSVNASAHDNDLTKPKKFSDRFISTLFPGNIISPDPSLMPSGAATEASALDEVVKLVDLIYEQPETARNICRKIYRFFVWAPHTNAEVLAIETGSNDIIGMMADTFVSSGFKIQPVIENLLRSQHFYEASPVTVTDDNFGGLIKSPLDLVIGTLRFFNIQLPDMQTQTSAFYKATDEILETLKIQGLDFFEPYDVAGYNAYHQYPIYHRAWITTNSLAQRYDFIRHLFDPESNWVFNVNAYTFINTNFAAVASDANALVKELIIYLLPLHDSLTFDETAEPVDKPSLTTKRLTYLKKRFLSDISSTPEAYWATTWSQANDIADLRLWLNLLFDAILQSPEYQLA